MQSDQSVLSLRPGGGSRVGSRVFGPRFDSSTAANSDLPLLRPHVGIPATSLPLFKTGESQFDGRERIQYTKDQLLQLREPRGQHGTKKIREAVEKATENTVRWTALPLYGSRFRVGEGDPYGSLPSSRIWFRVSSSKLENREAGEYRLGKNLRPIMRGLHKTYSILVIHFYQNDLVLVVS